MLVLSVYDWTTMTLIGEIMYSSLSAPLGKKQIPVMNTGAHSYTCAPYSVLCGEGWPSAVAFTRLRG